MIHLKNFKNYLIKEADETEIDTDEIVDTEKENIDTYKDIIDQLEEMVKKTIERSGGEYKTFIKSFVKDSESFKIEGLINDSDIYEFYLKYRNQIDELLNQLKFYDTPPSEENVFGLYDYITKGTSKAVEELVKMMSEKL